MINIGVMALIFWAAPSIFSNVFVQPKMIAASVILLALWGREVSRKNLIPIAFFATVAILSTVFSSDLWTSVYGHYRAPYYGLVAIAIVSIIYLRAGGTADIRRALITAGLFAGAFSSTQAIAGESLIRGIAHIPSGRAIGLTGSPVFLGAILIPCFVATWDSLRKDSRGFLSGISLPFIICGVISAQARGAMLSCAVAVWAYETTGRKRWFGIFAIAMLLWAYVWFVPVLNNRERAELFRISVSAFLDHPWLGWGPDNFILAFRNNRTLDYVSILHSSYWGQPSAHSDIGQVLSTMGIIGLAAYLWLLSAIARSARGAFATACLAGVWMQAQTNPIPIELSVILALILGQDIAE